MTLVMTNMPKHVPFLIRPIAKKISEGVRGGFSNPRLKEHAAFLEAYFSQHDYAGEFSFADIQMSFPVIAMQQRTKNKTPRLAAIC
jgi:glutathione S-transferase